MYGIVIGASSEAMFGIEQGKKLGLRVLGFDGNANAEGLKKVDQAYVVDIRDERQILSVLEEKQIDASEVISIPVPVGRVLCSTGAVNSALNIQGVSKKCAEILTDKYSFHEILQEKGLRSAKCRLIKAGEELGKMDGPRLIVKPRYGAGSRNVRLITKEEDWEILNREFPMEEDFVVETAVEGQEYGIDGMVFRGKFSLVLLRKKINTPPPVCQCVGYLSVSERKDKELLEKVEEYCQQIVSLVGIEDGIMHGDLLVSQAMELFMIEMSARPSGHNLHNEFTPLVSGVNMIEEYIKYLITGEQPRLVLRHNQSESFYLIHYFDFDGKEITKVPGAEYLKKKYQLLAYECNLKKGKTMKVVDGHSIMGYGYFIIEGKSEKDVLCKSNQLLQEFL